MRECISNHHHLQSVSILKTAAAFAISLDQRVATAMSLRSACTVRSR